LEAALTLLGEVDELHRNCLPWLFRRAERQQLADFLQAYVSKPDHAMFLAVAADGGLAGVLYLFLRQTARAPVIEPTVVAEIDALAVGRAFRRQGIGTRLVEAALGWASVAGATRTELGVFEFNEPAQAFWASLGFQTLSRRLVLRSTPDN